MFGPDEFEVDLSGVCSGAVATCSGTAREAPEIRFECTLIYSQEEALPADAKCAVVKLNRRQIAQGARQPVAATAIPPHPHLLGQSQVNINPGNRRQQQI